MPYVSPEKFRTMGFGIDLDGIEDVELAALMERASAIADDYCTVPRFPVAHSFFGGSVTGEQHEWTLPVNPLEYPRRRVWPLHWPIQSVTDFKVKVTNTQYVSVAPTELFINNADRYVEVVSLAFTGVGLFGAMIPSIGLMRPVAEISYTYGWNFQARGELLYPTDARTYRAANQFWNLTDTEPIIYLNGVAQPSGFTVDDVEGTVTFDTALAATDLVTADYDYTLPREIKEGTGHIAAYLIAQRQVQSRGMGGLQSLKVGEVSITAPTRRLSAESLPELVPEAASLLADYGFITVR